MDQQPRRPSTALFVIALILFAAPVLLAWSALVVGQQTQSYEENRTLAQFPALKLSTFLDGSFQDQFEDALADQVPGGAAVKSAVQDVQSAASRAGKELIYSAVPSLRSNYEQITEGYYHYAGDSSRIVERPKDWQSYSERIAAFAERWGGQVSVPTYLYFIENSRTINFDDPASGHATAAWIAESMGVQTSAVFAVNGYEDFCARFYQTDHHWNKDGSYEGYQAIVRMLCGEDEPLLTPTGTV